MNEYVNQENMQDMIVFPSYRDLDLCFLPPLCLPNDLSSMLLDPESGSTGARGAGGAPVTSLSPLPVIQAGSVIPFPRPAIFSLLQYVCRECVMNARCRSARVEVLQEEKIESSDSHLAIIEVKARSQQIITK
jgi:hypothetical protein